MIKQEQKKHKMIKSFFEAKRIAVIGASREREKVGNIVFRNLLRNDKLKLFPVNPNADEVLGIKSYSSVLDIPFFVDMAVICVPATIVMKILEECGKKEIKNAVIISAGFAEAGNVKLQEEARKIAEKYKISIIGPNVLGIINTYKNLNASFFHNGIEKGNVSLISQSGAVGSSLLDKAIEEKLGLSCFISLGNMIGVDFAEALEFAYNDVYTETILIYIESLGENKGREFVDLCKKITKKKRIIALKAGKTEEGEKALKTHTASLSSKSKIYSSAFKQAGIIEVESLDEMFRLAEIFSKYKNLGRKACVVSNAGGLAVLAADALARAGIMMPEIPSNVLSYLDGFMSKGYSRRNPLDILGDANPERYEKILKILSRESFFDFFVVIVSPLAMTLPLETAKVILQLKRPVFACFVGGKNLEQAKRFLEDNKAVVLGDVSELNVLRKIMG